MQYCPKCRRMAAQEETACPLCGESLRAAADDDRVVLADDAECEINNLCAALSQQDIPFWEDAPPTSVASYKARSFQSRVQLAVSWSDYKRARGIAKTVGFVFPEDGSPGAKTPPQPVREKRTKKGQSVINAQNDPNGKAEEEELSPAKRVMGKILLGISVLAVLAAGVLLCDVVINWVKGMF